MATWVAGSWVLVAFGFLPFVGSDVAISPTARGAVIMLAIAAQVAVPLALERCQQVRERATDDEGRGQLRSLSAFVAVLSGAKLLGVAGSFLAVPALVAVRSWLQQQDHPCAALVTLL
jgi:predicted PurR-regulated permease PerM